MKQRTRQTLSIFWQHAKQYPWLMVLMGTGLVGYTALEVYVPFWYKKFFDTLALGSSGQNTELIVIITAILMINGVIWVLRRIGDIPANVFEPKVMADLKHTSYEHLFKHSYNFFNNNFSGSLVRKVNKYAQAFENVVDLIYFHVGRATIHVGILLTVVFIYYWQLGILMLAWMVVYVALNFIFSRYKLKYDIRRTELDTQATGHLADTITNNLNIQLFSSLLRETKIYTQLNEQLRKLMTFTWNLRAYADAIQGALVILLEFGVFYFAIQLWNEGSITIGDFALLQAYVIQIFHQLWGLGRFIHRIYENLSDAEEMTEILKTPHDIQDKPHAPTLKVTRGNVVFDEVYFAYPNQKNIFTRFSFNIQPGERVALIGPSGGGKSTLVKLLFRFFDIQKGAIIIDGTDISSVSQGSLRNAIGLVPQDPILFHRSLFENIRYGKKNASMQEVVKAAKMAHCHKFISRFPDGYNTFVGERGVKLSGGERQRVAIARAMLENAPILVLDEATSSLDSESEYYIQDAFKKLMKNKTTIVIAHRLSTIMQMDRIIVIENGMITEQGSHDELLKAKKGTYQKLWSIQAGGFVNS